MSVRRYDFHGVLLELTAGHAGLLRAVDDRLRHFKTERDGTPDVRFGYTMDAQAASPAAQPTGCGRRVYEAPAGDVLYFAADDVLHVEHDHLRVRCSPGEGEVRIWAVAPEPADVWLLSRPLLTLPLAELLKRRGLYSLHAAGVMVDGRAVLVPGASGAGKSTLTIALARAGLSFLSDDMVFLSHGSDVVGVHAFPDEVDVSAQTAAWFEELQAQAAPPPDGWPKHRVRVEEIYGVAVAMRCAPGALVFPRIADVARSELEPMSADDALLELAPNVLLTDPVSSQQHLDALAALVRRCPAYRLTTGRDFDRIGRLVRSIDLRS